MCLNGGQFALKQKHDLCDLKKKTNDFQRNTFVEDVISFSFLKETFRIISAPFKEFWSSK